MGSGVEEAGPPRIMAQNVANANDYHYNSPSRGGTVLDDRPRRADRPMGSVMKQSAQHGERIVGHSEIAELSTVAGTGFAVTGPSGGTGTAAVRGDYRMVRLRPGLLLHAGDHRQVGDFSTTITLRPSIKCSVVLEGPVGATFGNRPVELGHAGAGATVRPRSPVSTLIALAEPDTLLRHSRPDARVRKVNVSIEPEWLEAGGLDPVADCGSVLRFGREHLATRAWQPSARLVTLAEQILRPPAYAPALQHLYLESRAIEIAFEALAALTADAPRPFCHAVHTRDRRRLAVVREFLDANLDKALTLEAVARHAGMSVSVLQRLFRGEHGHTVFDYVRLRRLQRARNALEREGATVAQAAHLAGYSNTSNFSTAFRRAFGTTPGAVRS